MIRIANENDIIVVVAIYEKIQHAEEEGIRYTGWKLGVYPVRETAEGALGRGELFVAELNGQVVGSAILNGAQLDCYHEGNWKYQAEDNEVFVMHTLTIDPDFAGKGIGTAFIDFYRNLAAEKGCTVLRIDTREANMPARKMYRKYGFREAGIILSDFNNIPDVRLVLLEKPV